MALRHLVVTSIETDDGLRCVDIFQRADDTFGFQEFRRDYEDGRGWQQIGAEQGHRFVTAQLAEQAARMAVSWLDAVLSRS